MTSADQVTSSSTSPLPLSLSLSSSLFPLISLFLCSSSTHPLSTLIPILLFITLHYYDSFTADPELHLIHSLTHAHSLPHSLSLSSLPLSPSLLHTLSHSSSSPISLTLPLSCLLWYLSSTLSFFLSLYTPLMPLMMPPSLTYPSWPQADTFLQTEQTHFLQILQTLWTNNTCRRLACLFPMRDACTVLSCFPSVALLCPYRIHPTITA